MGIVRILYKRDWAAVGSGPQPIRVWGGATLAVGCYLPLAAAPNPNWLSQPIGLGLGEAQPLALLPPLAAGPRGVLPPYILYPLLSNTIIPFFPNSHLLSLRTIITQNVHLTKSLYI
jgi:hypothetical protein